MNASRQPPLIEISGLRLQTSATETLVNELSLTFATGLVWALVGESGSGKSLCCRALLGLLPPGISQTAGQLTWQGQAQTMPHQLAGRCIGYIPQNPQGALDPLQTVEQQLRETLQQHEPNLNGIQLSGRLAQALTDVQLKTEVLKLYPHELSGGMAQRVMIALALLPGPQLLIADEATTALDVYVQYQVIELLLGLVAARGLSLLLVSHDLALVMQAAAGATVLQGGTVVCNGPLPQLFQAPSQPYLRGLLTAYGT